MKQVNEIFGDVFVAKPGVNPDRWPRGHVPGISRGRTENLGVYEIDLDGAIPPKFDGKQIVSIGQEDLGDEAGILVTFTDGTDLELKTVEAARVFFILFYS